MGLIYADIELINGEDWSDARRNRLDPDEVRRITVSALVDTGSIHLAINETLKDYLGLPVVERRKGRLADGQIVELEMVGPIELRFKNRQSTVRAMVLPGDEEVLLGAIPMEDMDVLIDPVKQELIIHPEHPDMAVASLK